MGPNLTRLFAESKHKCLYDGTDGTEIAAYDRAQNTRFDLFDRHGEALIEALERLLEENEDYIRINNLSAMGNVNLVNARELLAQLEEEAKP